MSRQVAVLDTVSDQNVIRGDVLPEGTTVTKQCCGALRGATNKPLNVDGVATLHVRVGTQMAKQQFPVCEKLAVPAILSCQFCHTHVEAIKPRKRTVVLDDGSVVDIVRNPSARAKGAAPLAPSLKVHRDDRKGANTRVWAAK